MFLKNTAGQFIHVQGVDAATGGIKSGVTWTVRRCIDGTFAAATGTATEDGTTGWYKFAMSQADTNGNNIGFNFTGTGAVPQTVNIVTTVLNPYDAVRFGMTALPNAAAEAAGGLYTRGAGAGQINQPANGQIDANAVKLSGTTCTGRDIGASVLISSGTGVGQMSVTSGVIAANVTQIDGSANSTHATGMIAADIRDIVGAAVNTSSPQLGVQVNNIATAVVQAIWDALTSALTTTGSIGKLLVDNINATISSRSTYAGGAVASVSGNVDGNVTGTIGGLATQAKADVNAEVVDALNVDTYAEPGQEAPPATTTLVKKIGYIYKYTINKILCNKDTGAVSVYNNADTVVDHKATASDDGTNFTRGKFGTGP